MFHPASAAVGDPRNRGRESLRHDALCGDQSPAAQFHRGAFGLSTTRFGLSTRGTKATGEAFFSGLPGRIRIEETDGALSRVARAA